MEHNFLYLIWKNPNSRTNHIVGKLTREDKRFFFEYCGEYKEALNDGWELIKAFIDVKKYESDELFPVFASRLPDKKRRNIDEILDKYGLDSYDGYDLLKQSGGRLPTDTYEFIDPIFDDDKTIDKQFYIMGIRHLCGCEASSCDERPDLKLNDNLVLKMEPNNKCDEYAVQVLTSSGEYLGYIPRYYSFGVTSRLKSNMTYECIVVEINNEKNCQECVKVRLLMPKRNKK